MTDKEKGRLFVQQIVRGRDVASLVFVALAQDDFFDATTLLEHGDLFPEWDRKHSFNVGDIYSYKEILYKCVQAHKGQATWTPDKTPALWVKIGNPAEEWPDWAQPLGAHDAYMKGNKVSHKGKHWVSDIDNNIWEPGVYGWTQA